MTIASLPHLPTSPADMPVDTVVTGTQPGASEPTAESFVALVLAVLDTGPPAEPRSGTAGTAGSAPPGTAVAPEGLGEEAPETGSGQTPDQPDAVTAAEAPVPIVPTPIVPAPITLPAALAAALGLAPTAPAGEPDPAVPVLDAAPETGSGGPALRQMPTTSADPARPAGPPTQAPAQPPTGVPATHQVGDTYAGPVTGAQAARPSQAAEPADEPGPALVQATTGPAAPPRAAETAPTTALTRATAAQIVPELTRLVQAGPGTHRVVLRLEPEHLGEVRITLTVHPGGVRVRMSTSTHDAQAALSHGLQTLYRTLETVPGRPVGDTQVVVLHQQRPHEPGTTYDGGGHGGSGGGGLSAQTGDAHAAPHHQTPGDRPQADDRAAGRPARTQVDTHARDGNQGGGTSGPPRPADPLTSWRSARLDVSM